MKNITTVILVAGKSSRFKSNKSKIFHELAGLPIIDHIYNKVNKISKKIIFVCNKDNINLLKKKFNNCKFVIQKKQIGTADAVLSAKKLINKNSNILILFGDTPLITLKSLNKLFNNYFKNNHPGSIMAFVTNNPYGYGRVISLKNKVHKVVEELNASEDEKNILLCNAGVMIVKYNILFSFIYKISNKNVKKEKYLPDLFNIAHNNKKTFNFILCEEGEMLGINNLNDFNKIDEIYQNQLKEKLINKGVKIINPKSVRISFDTMVGKNTTIEPYVFIKKGVKINNDVIIKSHTTIESSIIGDNCAVGPYARIRPNSILDKHVKIGNYVEIKNSFIGKKCSISHLSYIGDSTLGKNINIGAGTITCNFDGKKKNYTFIEDNVFIGSNCSLIAPLKIKKNSKIGAGSVITKDVPSNSLALERAKMIILKKN